MSTTAAGQSGSSAGGRTYGNWRRPRSAGFYGQTATVTYAGIGLLVLALLVTIFVGGLTALVVAAVGVVVLAPLVLRVNGRTLYQAGVLRGQWARQRRRRATVYRSGPLSATPNGTHRLPGVLAATSLFEGRDAFGQTFGMVRMPKTSGYTVVLACDAPGSDLIEQDQIDDWVAAWGQWLSVLGQSGDIVAATVVVDTAPDSGERLAAEVRHLVRDDAPALAREILEQTAAEYPSGSALVSARVAITFRARTPERRRDPAEMAVEIGTRLPELYTSLRDAGVSASPMDGWTLAETVRLAYDPDVAQLIDAARGDGDGAQVVWADAGPAAAQESWASYTHDSGTSAVYAMETLASASVREHVLRRLLEPHRDIPRKRITLIYRPHEAGAAAKIVDSDHRDAIIAANRRGLVAAAADVALESTARAREEEARGAGVVRFSVLLTVTVAEAASLRRTDAVLRDLAASTRLKIRPCYGYQAAAFAAGLGIGVLLPEHATIPGALAN